jgi:hypothetical protein
MDTVPPVKCVARTILILQALSPGVLFQRLGHSWSFIHSALLPSNRAVRYEYTRMYGC